VAILQQKLQDLEQKLDGELRAKHAVQIDDKALGAVELPGALVDAATAPSPWSKKQEDAASEGADAGAPDTRDAGP